MHGRERPQCVQRALGRNRGASSAPGYEPAAHRALQQRRNSAQLQPGPRGSSPKMNKQTKKKNSVTAESYVKKTTNEQAEDGYVCSRQVPKQQLAPATGIPC